MSKLDFRIDGREIRGYFTSLAGYLTQTAVTAGSGEALELAEAITNQSLI